MLPVGERYNLVSQMQRAALSVTNNLAEGHGRWRCQDFMRFRRISRGSVSELLDDFNACDDEGYAAAADVEPLRCEARELINRINSYIAYLERRQQHEDQQAKARRRQPHPLRTTRLPDYQTTRPPDHQTTRPLGH